MNKPNPIKRTVEYCYIGDGKGCRFYQNGVYCIRYKKRLSCISSSSALVQRPELCTDELLIKLPIAPIYYQDQQYCCRGLDLCSLLYRIDKDTVYCPILNEPILSDTKIMLTRPKKCIESEIG